MGDKPRVEVIFKKGKPVTAFLHLRPGSDPRGVATIPIRPPLTAHYDPSGLPVGLEIPLPYQGTLALLNDALRDLGATALDDADLVALRGMG